MWPDEVLAQSGPHQQLKFVNLLKSKMANDSYLKGLQINIF